MMDEKDVRLIMADLGRRPPKSVLFLALALEKYARVFPSGDVSRLRFVSIERWIRGEYRPAGLKLKGYELWARK